MPMFLRIVGALCWISIALAEHSPVPAPAPASPPGHPINKTSAGTDNGDPTTKPASAPTLPPALRGTERPTTAVSAATAAPGPGFTHSGNQTKPSLRAPTLAELTRKGALAAGVPDVKSSPSPDVLNTDMKFTKMPWQTQVEIAVGSVAGAAALGGAIAGIVESQTTPEPRQISLASKAKLQKGATPVGISGRPHFNAKQVASPQKGATPVGASGRPHFNAKQAASPAPAPEASLAVLYDKPPAAAVMVDNAFIGVACGLLLIGCLFLSTSGFVYYKGRRTNRDTNFLRTLSESSYEEVSEEELLA